jgi:hypothetical protein
MKINSERDLTLHRLLSSSYVLGMNMEWKKIKLWKIFAYVFMWIFLEVYRLNQLFRDTGTKIVEEPLV